MILVILKSMFKLHPYILSRNLTRNFHSWTFRRKWAATAIVSAFTFISPVSSSMVAPATETIAAQFGITNDVLIAMTTSIFVLAYGED